MTPIIITLSLLIPSQLGRKKFWYGFRYGVRRYGLWFSYPTLIESVSEAFPSYSSIKAGNGISKVSMILYVHVGLVIGTTFRAKISPIDFPLPWQR